MRNNSYSKLVMLGTAPETRGGIASVVKAYQAHGLFERWPIVYVPTHCDGSRARKLERAVSAFFSLTRHLLGRRVPVLHVHAASRASFWRKSVFMLLGVAARCPIVFHLHGGGFSRFYEQECSPLQRRVVRFFLDRAVRVVVLSGQWAEWMATATSNPNIVCIANPVPRPSKVRAERRNMVLFLGRLERAKGIYDLIEAFAAVRARVPDAELVCAGDGDLDAVARRAGELGMREAVHLTGWIGDVKKAELLASAAVFVLPSYAEGSPISLLEAMAAGVPPVASAVGGIPDLIAEGANGFLVQPGDRQTLATRLSALLLDPSLRERLGAAAADTVRERFDIDRVMTQLEQMYAAIGLVPLGPLGGGKSPNGAAHAARGGVKAA
jgi:glycosyltransferase involved in cell wall biosynthesis